MAIGLDRSRHIDKFQSKKAVLDSFFTPRYREEKTPISIQGDQATGELHQWHRRGVDYGMVSRSGGEERGQFAGHETFPLRLLWLKKAHDAVGEGVETGFFQRPEAIVHFGVGRNMAVSMRFWALASGMATEQARRIEQTPLGRLLLDNDGLDPYLESPATIWLVHWYLASKLQMTTTIHYAFNHINSTEFTAESLAKELASFAVQRGWKVSEVTLKRDVEVFLRGYVRRSEMNVEDAAEPLLAELGLIRSMSPGPWFEFIRGPKPTLPDEVFLFALIEFWSDLGSDLSTLTAEQISYAPGSPGRAFKLDENSVVSRLMNLDELTNGALIWTDTAGLRQVQRRREMDALALLPLAYARGRSRA